MTVRELIKFLLDCSMDAPVYIEGMNRGAMFDETNLHYDGSTLDILAHEIEDGYEG